MNAVKYWLDYLLDFSPDVICILGNKNDLKEDDNCRDLVHAAVLNHQAEEELECFKIFFEETDMFMFNSPLGSVLEKSLETMEQLNYRDLSNKGVDLDNIQQIQDRAQLKIKNGCCTIM